jgi:hypothetical protein
MNRAVALVEGQTEQGFIRDVLAPWLAARGVYMTARLVGKPGHKGGVGEYPRARRDMLLLLKQEAGTTITTMFDFYGMPDSWPGRSDANSAPFAKKALTVETALKTNIMHQLGGSFDGSRFLPYVQMHEFESLLFAQPPKICDVLRCPEKQAECVKIRSSFSSPEEINDGPQTAPSKRIRAISPAYRKRLHGLIAASRIGIEVMISECPHFAEWVHRLELLSKR